MTKWIFDGSVACREVSGTRHESYNSLSGSPTFKVRLEVPAGQVKLAKAKLLGKPETWPHDSIFLGASVVACVACEEVTDQGAYTTDADGQLCNYINNHLLDCTYIARAGIYVEDMNSEDVYWDDEIKPRFESRPADNMMLMWGGTDEQSIPQNKVPLNPDAAPPIFQGGETLTHTIEGWTLETATLQDVIGTCNDELYVSVPLHNREYSAGTLMLRNYEIIHSFSFRSYRIFSAQEPFSGKPTITLKLYYEYRKDGWQKFWRVNPDLQQAVYEFIRYIKSPHDIFNPFPVVSHAKWLSL